ncbi:uncharacterized protein LOC110444316 [Mizuhopecten yessoensis]|uniref:uncharacterized protein LOC110444316 n=1 Tax=Mizuhopecten yessoensis TaxID=6573 RepID=UPI000B45F56B|nr:uncharacterized protein LOC110444316 [Mizuhopecten yessoensis]
MTFGKTLDYTDVTADDCAKLCVTTEATNCQSFAFCNTTQLCRLTSNRPLKKGGNVTHDVCDLYIRKYFSTGHSQASSNTGYSAGAMAGVGIGLFLPGLLIGALVTFYFRRKHDQSLEALDMQQIVKD